MENNTAVQNTPRDVLLHLLNIFTFYISVISFITLYIQYISALFPDPLNFYYTAISNSIRVSTSILVIAIPVFLLTSWMLAKNLGESYEKREFKLRKWLIYFTLFISAITIIIDLIIFVYNFLSGELTIQFFLKVLVVLAVTAAVFGYYIWELKRKDMKTKTPKILAGIISAVVITSIVLGFFVIGTPAAQRNRRFDEQRVGDLQMLQNQIINYWIQKQALPLELGNLEDSISGFIVPIDPESKLSYEYEIAGFLSFELCATFKTSGKDFGKISRGVSYPYPVDYLKQNWDHGAEKTCFTRTIDPELYKDTNSGQLKVPVPVQ